MFRQVFFHEKKVFKKIFKKSFFKNEIFKFSKIKTFLAKEISKMFF